MEEKCINENGHIWKNKGLVATDRNSKDNRLIFSSLQQCIFCKEIKIEEDY